MSTTAWDWPSTVVSLLLGSGGIAFSVLAARPTGPFCSSGGATAHFFLVLAALFTVQLLAFAISCFVSRYWVATNAASTRVGPGVHEPRVRRGLPALKRAGSIVGLDGWSLLLIAILGLPLVVSALVFLKPSDMAARWSPTKQEPLGISRSNPSVTKRNGGNKYTVAAYETVQLAMQAETAETNNQNIQLSNTATVALDVANDRVYGPTRVNAACMYPEVVVRNVTALVGSYSCAFKRGQRDDNKCLPSDYSTGKNQSCIAINNGDDPSGVTRQTMTYKGTELLVKCHVVFSLARVDVTWHGDDQQYRRTGRSRDCYIANVTLLQDIPMAMKDWEKWENYMDLLGNDTLQPMKLPLINAYTHIVSKERVQQSSDDSLKDFFGAIFSAAIIVRTTGANFDPTQSSTKVEVRYISSICAQYGWSGFVIFLITVNALLALYCTVGSSGVAMHRVTESFSSICSKSATHADGSTTPHAPTSAPPSFPHANHSIQASRPSQQSRTSGPAVTSAV